MTHDDAPFASANSSLQGNPSTPGYCFSSSLPGEIFKGGCEKW